VGQQDGDVEIALKGSERAEDGRDIGGRVFIDPANEPDKGIENDEAGFARSDRGPQACKVLGAVEAKHGHIDEKDGQMRKVASAGFGQALEAGA
jgi:hypothetical protein